MPIDRIIKSIVPAAIGYVTGGPVKAVTAFAEADRARTQKNLLRKKLQEYRTNNNK